MTEQDDIRRNLDSCQYSYLVSFTETGTFDLQLEVIEARAGGEEYEPSSAEHDNSDYQATLDTMLKGSTAIGPRPGCALFTITFENYLMFSVRNETFAISEKDEDFSKRLRTYTSSRLLDYVAGSYCVDEDIHRPLRHMAVVCLDRIVDVVTTSEPRIDMRITDASEYTPRG